MVTILHNKTSFVTKKIINPKDSELFRQAVGDVRVVTSDKIQPSPPHRARPYPKQPPQTFDSDSFDRLEGEINPVSYEETLSFMASGVQQAVLAKLRKGFFGVQGELDLHGYTIEEAKRLLSAFLSRSMAAGHRCVHIIHGKGYRSPEAYPVLKNNLNRWLRQHHDVLAFCSASPRQGGAGAVFVLLKVTRQDFDY